MVCLTIAGMLKLRKFSRLTLLFVKEAGCSDCCFLPKQSLLSWGLGASKTVTVLGEGTLEIDGRQAGGKTSLLLCSHLLVLPYRDPVATSLFHV